MDNINISSPLLFTEELRKLQTTDKAHADVFNQLFEKLLNNDIYLNRLADAMVKKESITHEVTESNPNMIVAADVIAKLQEQIANNNKITSHTPTVLEGIQATEGGNVILKQGNICMLYPGYFGDLRKAGDDIHLGMIPQELRPLRRVSMRSDMGMVFLETSGLISTKMDVDTKWYLWTPVPYICI